MIRHPYVPFPYNHLRMKLAEINRALGTRLENGSPDTEILGVAGIETAGPGQLTFVANPKYATAARSTKASAVIVAENSPPWKSSIKRRTMLPEFIPRLSYIHPQKSERLRTLDPTWLSPRMFKSAKARCCWRM